MQYIHIFSKAICADKNLNISGVHVCTIYVSHQPGAGISRFSVLPLEIKMRKFRYRCRNWLSMRLQKDWIRQLCYTSALSHKISKLLYLVCADYLLFTIANELCKVHFLTAPQTINRIQTSQDKFHIIHEGQPYRFRLFKLKSKSLAAQDSVMRCHYECLVGSHALGNILQANVDRGFFHSSFA